MALERWKHLKEAPGGTRLLGILARCGVRPRMRTEAGWCHFTLGSRIHIGCFSQVLLPQSDARNKMGASKWGIPLHQRAEGVEGGEGGGGADWL